MFSKNTTIIGFVTWALRKPDPSNCAARSLRPAADASASLRGLVVPLQHRAPVFLRLAFRV